MGQIDRAEFNTDIFCHCQAHYDYHRALSARLTHELRTPLSVVRTSIENYQPGDGSAENLASLDRARSGADQLSMILRSLGESERLEDMVADVELDELEQVLDADVAKPLRCIWGQLILPGVPRSF